jgi:hypothetical protein
MWALNRKGCGIIHAVERVESSLLVADHMFTIFYKNLAKQNGKFELKCIACQEEVLCDVTECQL